MQISDSGLLTGAPVHAIAASLDSAIRDPALMVLLTSRTGNTYDE